MQNVAVEMGLEIYLKVTGEHNFLLGKWWKEKKWMMTLNSTEP